MGYGPGGVYGYFNFSSLYGARGYEAGGWYGDSSAYRVANGIEDHRPADSRKALLDGSGRLVHRDCFVAEGTGPQQPAQRAPLVTSGAAGAEAPAPTSPRPEVLDRFRVELEGQTLSTGFLDGRLRLRFDDGFLLDVFTKGGAPRRYSLHSLEALGRAKLNERKPLGNEVEASFSLRDAREGEVLIASKERPNEFRPLKSGETIPVDSLLKPRLIPRINTLAKPMAKITLDFGNGHGSSFLAGHGTTVDVAKHRRMAEQDLLTTQNKVSLMLPADMERFGRIE